MKLGPKEIKELNQYLITGRNKQREFVTDDTLGMAQGGRIGFYRGEKVVKSHGKQIKDLTEAGESSVSIAKKLKLKQQTVNAAMDAMDKGVAGKEFKLSKPRKDIIKLAVNETGVNLKDPKHLEEVIKYIDDNPNANQADAKKIFGRRKAELVDPNFYGSPGKKWDDEKAKLRNKARLELTKERSSPSIESKMVAPKESGLNFHHAGFKKSLVDLKNTMYIPGGSNRKMVKLFEDPLLKEMETFTKVFDDPKATTKQKQKAATDYLKNDRALRQKYPEFKDFKTRLSFKRTSLDPSGIMFKEKLRDPSLAISQEPGMTLKGETPSTPRGKEILKKAKQSLETVSDGPTLGMNLGLFRGLGEAVKAVPTPLGTAALTAGVGVDPKSSIDRASIAAEAAFAPALVQQSAKMGAAQRFFNLGLPAKTALRLSRLASPIGIAALGAEGLYQAGKFTKKRMDELKRMSPEQRQELRSEGARQAFDPFMAAGGGIAKEAGDPSGRPPESGPQPQGLLSLKNRARNY